MNTAGMGDVPSSNQGRDAKEVMRSLIVAKTRREGLVAMKERGLQ